MYFSTSIKGFFLFFSLAFNIVLYGQIKNETTTVGVEDGNGDQIAVSASELEDIVDYKAQRISNEFTKMKTYLLTDAKVTYQDIEINADYIVIDWNADKVNAYSEIDSTGKVISKAKFKQAGKEYLYESFAFNFKTKKGTVYNARTIENNLVTESRISKRINDSVYYISKSIITGDEYYRDNKDTRPDYFIAIDKGKFITDNSVIAGASQLYIEEVPTPLFLPFMYIPIKGKRSAGIVIPSFGETNELGFYLQGMGVYTPIGPYFDLEILGDLYSKGSTGIHAMSRYKKNYKYTGSLRVDLENRITGIKGITEGVNAYSKSNNFRINWSHTQDRKANPNLIFRANVGFSSSRFFRQSIDNNNIYNGNFLNNTSNSSISIDKYFNDFPMNFSLTATLNQNFNTEQANMTLPQFNANLKRRYPFQKSDVRLFSKMYFDYRMNVNNQMTATTEELFSKESFADARSGVRNLISVGTQTNFLKYLTFTISGDYNEIWQLKTVEKMYNAENNTVETNDINGFYAWRTYNFNSSLNTILYGTKYFKQGARIEGIRHTITPSANFTMQPDFGQDRFGYYDYYTDANGNQVKYSRFEGGVFGSPGQGLRQSIGFGIGNNLELKVRSKTDSTGVQKVKIFDYLNISGNYNFGADSLQLSDIGVNGSTTFFKRKFKLNYRTSINPYKIEFLPDAITGIKVDELGHFSVLNYFIGLNFSLNNEFFSDPINYAERYDTTGPVRYDVYYFDEMGYARFNSPWQASVGLNYNYTKGYSLETTKNIGLNVTGSFSPAPYWRINATTNYDFVAQNFGNTRISLQRDLRSFVIDFNWVPFGAYRSWNFSFYIKTSVLRDALKYDDKDYRRSNNAF